MDLTTIFEKQAKLNAANQKVLPMPAANLLKTKRLIALTVELAEFANEWGGFKYWKPQHQINASKMIEEYVDVLHFLSSFALIMHLEPIVQPRVISLNLDEHLAATFKEVASFQTDHTPGQLHKIFELYLGIGKIIGYSDEAIQNAYMRKNAINFERIENIPNAFKIKTKNS